MFPFLKPIVFPVPKPITTPPLDTFPKDLFRTRGYSLNSQRSGRPLWLANRPYRVQPLHKTLRNERGTLGQLQGPLQAVIARETFPERERWNRHALTKELPTLGFRPQHITGGQSQVEIPLPQGPFAARGFHRFVISLRT